MRTFSGQHEGDLRLSEDLELLGMVTGTLTVPQGRYLDLKGTVKADLVIENGGRAVVRGKVDGTVRNLGGDVEILGMVGAVHDVGATRSTIASGAVITGAN